MSGSDVTRIAKLTLLQPWDLTTGKLLQTQIAASGRLGPSQAALWTSVDLRSAAPVKELGASLDASLGPVILGGRYTRWTPQAERLQRTIYELAAPDPEGAPWLHTATASLGIGM